MLDGHSSADAELKAYAIDDVEYDKAKEQLLDREWRQEAQSAIFDIFDEAGDCITLSTHGGLHHPAGPYILEIVITDQKFVTISFKKSAEEVLASKTITNEAFYEGLKNHRSNITNYFEAIKKDDESEMDKMSAARKNSHDEGAEFLRAELAPSIELVRHADPRRDVGRFMYTLIAALTSQPA